MSKIESLHYFPGHMRKAANGLPRYLKAADALIEVCDARAPISTRNPFLSGLGSGKPRLLLLSKADLAEEEATNAWLAYFLKQGILAFASDLTKDKTVALLREASAPIVAEKRAKEKKLGMKKQPLRLMVVGIPNVGKSTLIDNLAGRKAAKAANTPGVTKGEQWITLADDFVLLDTPGILPLDYPDGPTAVRLALLGSIKEEVLPNEELSFALLGYLKENYSSSLSIRYGLSDIAALDSSAILSVIGRKRGLLALGGEPDTEKAAKALLRDFRSGALGRITLERPS